MTFGENVGKCHPCAYRQRRCAGPCVCTADGKRVDIIDHAKSDQCPKGYFGKKDNPLVEYVGRSIAYAARPAYAIPEGYDPEQEGATMRQGGCCGTPSLPAQ